MEWALVAWSIGMFVFALVVLRRLFGTRGRLAGRRAVLPWIAAGIFAALAAFALARGEYVFAGAAFGALALVGADLWLRRRSGRSA